ncbi:MAG TPA: SprT family zinc-dependent metalloprotease [Gemmatimonadales bacterium]|jgi:hypothetical protein
MTDEVEMLERRLAAHGLRPVARLRVTNNRSVLVSFSRKRVLSVHRGYAAAPDRVLAAIVRFVAPGTPREMRKAAEHEIRTFHPIASLAAAAAGVPAPRSPDRPQPGDIDALRRLAELFHEYNVRHFAGRLPEVPIRLSGRMRSRLGHLTLGTHGDPTEITISRRHLGAHPWEEVAHTLLHEMVHLWQWSNGQAVDHGAAFRAKAREIGVTAAARRWVRPTRRRANAPTRRDNLANSFSLPHTSDT